MNRDELIQAGTAFTVLIDKLVGLEAWATAWGARLMDTVDELLRAVATQPTDGGRDILRLWVDRDGLLQMAIDAPREGDGRESGGIEDEAHFAALYEQLHTSSKLIQQILTRMRGTTGVH